MTSAAASPESVALWKEAWSPSAEEQSYRVTNVEGEIPREIHGTLYRNGPSQRIAPREGLEALHLFDGDGLVHAFRFDEGHLDYTGRFVRTEGFLYEEKVGGMRKGFYSFPVEDEDPEAPGRVGPNTNVVHHAGHLLALIAAAPPYELDPHTLESLGWRPVADPMLGPTTSAHPKIDGRSGQMVIHGYQPFPPFVQLYVVEPDGRCSLAETVDAPFASMMHDLAITENHVIFLCCPVTFDPTRGACLKEWLAWEPEKGLHFGVRERRPGAPTRWIQAPTPGFIFHQGNAYETPDGKIVMDACTYPDGAGLLEALSGIRAGRMFFSDPAPPELYTIDPKAGTCTERRLSERGAEFPRLDDRLVGHANRFGYAIEGAPGGDGIQAGEKWITKYARDGSPSKRFFVGKDRYPSEPVFVPRHADAEEDDGFLLSVVFDGASHGSELLVLDARNVEGEPLARAHLEHRIPMGFHGNFAPGVV